MIAPPAILHKLFSAISNIEIDMEHGKYYVLFNSNLIAEVESGLVTLVPGPYINRNVNVFKTYNRILQNLVNKKYILKFKENVWHLAEIIE